MLPECRSVIKRLRDYFSFVGICIKLGFNDIQFPVFIDSNRVYWTAVCRKLASKYQKTDIFLDIVERDTLWIIINVFLQMIFLIKSRLVYLHGLFAVG